MLILAVLAVVFFACASSYIYLSQKGGFVKWSSPDETANYFFSKLYAQNGEFSIFEKYNLYAKDIIHPRSFRSDFGFLKPVSFLGLPLVYGKIASFTTWKVIGYLTPIFAAIGIIYFYLFLKMFFSRRTAIFSAFLLAVFPVYFYYSARSMFHNVLFTVFLIIGLYYTLKSVPKKEEKENKNNNSHEKAGAKLREKFLKLDSARIKDLLLAGLGGLFIGLAVTARSSELLWLGPLFGMIWIFNFWRFGIPRLVIWICFFGLALSPMLFNNYILYSSPIRGGYPEMNQSIQTVAMSGQELAKSVPDLAKGSAVKARGLAGEIKRAVFSFGLNVPRSLKIFNLYYVKMFPWLFWPSLAGMLLFLLHFRKIKKKHILYLLGYLFLSAVLIVYYGSWEFYDNPDRQAATIGNSYTRYWLPVYLGAIPFVSYLFFKLIDAPKLLIDWLEKANIFKTGLGGTKRLFSLFRSLLTGLAVVFFTSLYANFILFGSEEGLVPTYYKGLVSRIEYAQVLGLTENNAVIITRYHDKIFFPERKVVMGQFDDPNMITEYAHIADYLPLYYYNFSYKPEAVEYLNNGILGKANLKMKEIKKITKDFTLYKIEPIDKVAAAPKVRRKIKPRKTAPAIKTEGSTPAKP